MRARARPREKRLPTMTTGQATTFETLSIASALQVDSAISARKEAGIHPDCACQAYADVFTFRRWIALGHCVVKGEKAIRVASYARSENRREETDSARLRPVCLSLFCRCQVRPLVKES